MRNYQWYTQGTALPHTELLQTLAGSSQNVPDKHSAGVGKVKPDKGLVVLTHITRLHPLDSS